MHTYLYIYIYIHIRKPKASGVASGAGDLQWEPEK